MTRGLSTLCRLAFLVALPGGPVACDTIFGLDAKPQADAKPMTDAGAGGQDADGSHEAGDVALPPGAAIAVSSSFDVEGWCAVTSDGSVFCWGDNEEGELGLGSSASWTDALVRIEGLPPASQVVTSDGTVCALTRSGAVYCWGRGLEGELGNGTMGTTTATPTEVSGLSSGVSAISAGGLDVCAIKGNGSLWCWGFGQGGQLGNGSTANAPVPVPVKGLTTGVTSVSVGEDTTCAVQEGRAFCWGGTSPVGELGDGNDDPSNTPREVSNLKDVAAVSAGELFACALTTSGSVYCWGYGPQGQLGDDDVANRAVPVPVSGLTSGVLRLSAGMNSACAIKVDGSVVCWGGGDDGELGNGEVAVDSTTAYQSAVPVEVHGISSNPIAISTGSAPCIVTSKGTVECWGTTSTLALSPVAVARPVKCGSFETVTLGGNLDTMDFACALTTDGWVQCWGGNGRGQLGDGTFAASNVPVDTGCAPGSTSVAAGAFADFACAVTAGIVQCWGDNSAGQLGVPSSMMSSSAVPLTIQGLTDAMTVSVGALSACALTTGGAVWCWGGNTYGQLGNNSTSDSTTPVQALGSGVIALSVGNTSACAVLSSGTVECWGDNPSGQLGNGSTTLALTPTPVVGLDDAKSVSMGWYSACAVTGGGAVMCWGDNFFDELGNDNQTLSQSNVPVGVLELSVGATAVSVGQISACAIVAAGVYCWGTGLLGSGFDTQSATPLLVTGLESGVGSIAVGVNTSCAVVNDNLRCWGANTVGQLGIGAASNEFVATPVPGFP